MNAKPNDEIKKILMAYPKSAFYHFTDIRNIDLIKQHKGLYSIKKQIELGIEVQHPGGNNISRKIDKTRGLDAYVHLCFNDNHQMEYRAKEDGRIGESKFLKIDTDILDLDEIMYSPGVANKTGTQIVPISTAIKQIDYEILYKYHDFRIPEYKNRIQLAQKCEILIPNHVPVDYIENI